MTTDPARAAVLINRQYERTVRPLYDQITAARRERDRQLKELRNVTVG